MLFLIKIEDDEDQEQLIVPNCLEEILEQSNDKNNAEFWKKTNG